MPWIESHLELEEHPKLYLLVSKTGWSKDEAIARLHRLWWWALRYAEDGDLNRYEPSQFLVRLDDKKDPNELLEILKECNWVDKNGILHDWLEFAGRYINGKYRTSNPNKLKEIHKKNKSAFRQSLGGPKTDNLPNLTLPNQTNKQYINVFEELWESYPNKDGKKSAYRDFSKSVISDQDVSDIRIAIKNYLASKKVAEGYIKNGSTWFHNWRDWVNYVEVITPKNQLSDKIKELLKK